MPQLPIVTVRMILKVLASFGYMPVRQRGSHIRLACKGRTSITVPDYKTIDRSLLVKILRDADISADEFLARLKSL